MIVAKAKFKDDSVNIQYLLEQARNNPQLFQFSNPGDMEKTVRTHSELLESYKSFIDVLEDQRDRNLTHLDLKHVKQPEWRESQTQLDLDKVEQLYQDLTGLMIVYHSKFFGHEFNFNDWQTISQQEVDYLISYYQAYQSKT